MSSDTRCPMCHDGALVHAEGRLDQSGDSYLPTMVWTCPRCEYSSFEPALHVRWRPAVPSRLPEAHRDEGPTPLEPRRAA